MNRFMSLPVGTGFFSLVIVIATVSLVGCRNSAGSGSATPGVSQTGEGSGDSSAAMLAAEAALLTLDDFPAGWTARPPEDDDDPEIDLPAECNVLAEDKEFPGMLAEAETETFHGPDDEEVTSDATVYADDQSADGALQFIKDFIANCREPFQDAMEAYLEQVASEDAPIEFDSLEVNFDQLSFPDYGDDPVALRISVNAQSSELPFPIDVYVDIIGFRLGRATAGISSQSIGDMPDSAEEQRLLTLIEQRLTTALSSLE